MSGVDTSSFVPRVSLADAVYNSLRDSIVSGELAEGTELNQVQLAQKFGVSRIPVREALRRLQAESWVVLTPYTQYVVHRLTPQQVLELAEIRILLEPFGLQQAAPHAPEVLAELRKMNRSMRRNKDGNAFLERDRAFHRMLLGPDTMVTLILDDVRRKIHRYLSQGASGQPRRLEACEEHDRILERLEAGDVEGAVDLVRAHLRNSTALLAQRLGVEWAPSGSDADTAGS